MYKGLTLVTHTHIFQHKAVVPQEGNSQSLHCYLLSSPWDIFPSFPALTHLSFSVHLLFLQSWLYVFLIDGALIELTSVWFLLGDFPSAFSLQDVCQCVCRLLIRDLMLALVAMREKNREREMRLDILLDSEQNSWNYYCFHWEKLRCFNGAWLHKERSERQDDERKDEKERFLLNSAQSSWRLLFWAAFPINGMF